MRTCRSGASEGPAQIGGDARAGGAYVTRAVGLGEALAEQRQRDGQVGEHYDVPTLGRFLSPRDALGVNAGPTQAPEDGVVGRDLDGRHVGASLSVPALSGHAGGGDLDEVLGHSAPAKMAAVPVPGSSAGTAC